MPTTNAQCLILSCGNTLRSDDGVGPFLSEWAAERFDGRSSIRILTCHQWTPELALDLSAAETALFLDCALDAAPGEIRISEVQPADGNAHLATHHLDAPALLALAQDFYHARPRRALLLTVGAGSIELGEQFSPTVRAALPKVQAQLAAVVEELLAPCN